MAKLKRKLRQKDLDAFRLGVEQQVREEEREKRYQEERDRMATQRHVKRVQLVEAKDLRPGDVVVETNCVRWFRQMGTVTDITSAAEFGKPIQGDVWVRCQYTPGGRGGHALKNNAQVLIEERR